MKRSLPALAALGLAALAPCASQAQNLLFNPDLGLPLTGDVAPTGWTLTESPVPDRDSATLTDFADHTTPGADNRGLWLKPFEGNFPGFPDVLSVDADLTQAVPGIPGTRYQMSGWARFEGGYAGGVDTLHPSAPRQGTPLTDTVFALEFLNAGSSLLGGTSIELKAAGQTNNNEWLQHSFSAVAPAGTAFVRVRASMIDGEFNADLSPGPGQSAFFDDFSLTIIPEPGTGLLGLLGLAGLGAARRRA
jgi:hypothetical protein